MCGTSLVLSIGVDALRKRENDLADRAMLSKFARTNFSRSVVMKRSLLRDVCRRIVPALTFAVTAASASLAQGGPARLPPIRHVFILMLENQGYDSTFRSDSPAPYLADSLVKAGAVLTQYYGIAHFSLGNYIALISGMPPTRETQIDCPRYIDFVDSARARGGQPSGSGCIYSSRIATVANQLESKRLTWKAYMEDMGNDPTRESATCGHPTIGMLDSTQRATPVDQYATKHDPFVYFHSILDKPTCHANVVALPALDTALRSLRDTPNYSFISPSLCHDGHDRPCANGEPGGLVSANAFLREWIPRITHSPAFLADGLLIITFDEALSIDATACCDEPSGPNVHWPGVNGPGGGRVGAVLLSPFIKPGTRSSVPYNHYSLLRSVEDLFGLDHLGYAGQKGLATFGDDIFGQWGAK
jgi:phosphatidylinositol-3-phosphatase